MNKDKNNMTSQNASCLCGKVVFEVETENLEACICHCNTCRKLGCNSHIGVPCSEKTKLDTIHNLKWFDSSDWGQRGFCDTCGTNLFFRLKPEAGKMLVVSATALDNEKDVKIVQHIFIDKKPNYYDFKDTCPRLTEAEFLAQFAEEAES